MHAAVVECRAFELVPFAGGQSRGHVADPDDGQLADLALGDEILDRIVIPGVAQIEVDRGEERRVFSQFHGFPFVFDVVGNGFFGNDVFSAGESLFDLRFPRVGQGEQSHGLYGGVVEDFLFVGDHFRLRGEFPGPGARFGRYVADAGDLPFFALSEFFEEKSSHSAEADQTDSDGVHL